MTKQDILVVMPSNTIVVSVSCFGADSIENEYFVARWRVKQKAVCTICIPLPCDVPSKDEKRTIAIPLEPFVGNTPREATQRLWSKYVEEYLCQYLKLRGPSE